MRKLWLVDLDGTLSNPEHRRHWVLTKPKNWPAFSSGCINDPPIEPVVDVVKALSQLEENDIYFLSGRESTVRLLTLTWLHNVLGESVPSLNTRLYMRGYKDYRPDEIVKKELYNLVISLQPDSDYKVMGVFDDRNKVVAMWKSLGLFVFHVNQSGEDF